MAPKLGISLSGAAASPTAPLQLVNLGRAVSPALPGGWRCGHALAAPLSGGATVSHLIREAWYGKINGLGIYHDLSIYNAVYIVLGPLMKDHGI